MEGKRTEKLHVSGLSVMLGIPAGRNPSWETVMSLVGTFTLCQQIGVRCEPGIIKGCSIITKARDEVLHAFLESTCDRLLWIDDDMVWTPAQFVRMLGLSTRYEVVGAAYTAKIDPPTFYIKAENTRELFIDELGVAKVEGLGLGFTMMRREAAEAVAATKPRMTDQISGRTMASVFRTDILDGHFRGEDMAFFADLRALGYDIHLDTQMNLGHVGVKEYRGAITDAVKLIPQAAEQAAELACANT